MSENQGTAKPKKGLGVLFNWTNLGVIFWTTIVGGFISSLVKWGSEVNMPPRPPGELSPPGAHINDWGQYFMYNGKAFDQHSLDYIYQGNNVLAAVTIYHWLFSFAFTFTYVLFSIWWPRIRWGWGAFYGLITTAWAHWLMIPLLGYRYPSYIPENANGGKAVTGWAWNLNWEENLSEIIGHIYWSFSIEICMIAVLALFARPVRGDWVKLRGQP